MSDPQLDIYKKNIEDLFDSKSDLPIGNSTEEHAAALYELFFRKARTEVVVFCQKAAKEVFKKTDVLTALKNAAQNGIKVRFVTQSDSECSELDKIHNISVKRASAKDEGKVYNFCVVDDYAFRYEPDKNQLKGFARMNYPEDAKKLRTHFDLIWDRAQACVAG